MYLKIYNTQLFYEIWVTELNDGVPCINAVFKLLLYDLTIWTV